MLDLVLILFGLFIIALMFSLVFYIFQLLVERFIYQTLPAIAQVIQAFRDRTG